MSQFFALGGLFLGIDCAKGGRMDTCICMAESLGCLLETITRLLIGYTPIQNKKFKISNKKLFFKDLAWNEWVFSLLLALH